MIGGEVLWTDKLKFEVLGSQRRKFVSCRTNEKMLEKWRKYDGLGVLWCW